MPEVIESGAGASGAVDVDRGRGEDQGVVLEAAS